MQVWEDFSFSSHLQKKCTKNAWKKLMDSDFMHENSFWNLAIFYHCAIQFLKKCAWQVYELCYTIYPVLKFLLIITLKQNMKISELLKLKKNCRELIKLLNLPSLFKYKGGSKKYVFFKMGSRPILTYLSLPTIQNSDMINYKRLEIWKTFLD